MHTAFIVCGGGPAGKPASAMIGEHPDAFVIAADGGLVEAIRLGLHVDLLIGDLDSVPAGALETYEAEGGGVERHPRDKDSTDLDRALTAALDGGVEHAVVLGGAGGRFDHLLGNALVITSPRFAAMEIDAVFGAAMLHVVRGRRSLAGAVGEVVSVVAPGAIARGVDSGGLRWPLRGRDLEPGMSLGISNEFATSDAWVEVGEGVALVIRPGSG
jgi:thiamine pyrophosphokinase